MLSIPLSIDQQISCIILLRPHILRRRHQKAPRPTGRITDHLMGTWSHQRHHHLDNVARRAKLPIRPCCCQLREHVLIQIALRIPILHRNLINLSHHIRQQRRIGNQKHRILHMTGIGTLPSTAPQILNKRKCLIPHNPQHLLRIRQILKMRPPRRLKLRWKLRILYLPSNPPSLFLLIQLQIIQPLNKKEIRDLFDNRKRITDAVIPKRCPQAINLRL